MTDLAGHCVEDAKSLDCKIEAVGNAAVGALELEPEKPLAGAVAVSQDVAEPVTHWKIGGLRLSAEGFAQHLLHRVSTLEHGIPMTSQYGSKRGFQRVISQSFVGLPQARPLQCCPSL